MTIKTHLLLALPLVCVFVFVDAAAHTPLLAHTEPRSVAAATAIRLSSDLCGQTINIMPLGNSITRGYGSGPQPTVNNFNHGYRSYLDASLTAAGYNFDFVGTLSDGSQSGFTFDYDHQGYGGFRADQLLGVLPGNLTTTQPHVILMHIGTNDVAQRSNGNYAADVNDVAGLLDQIDAYDEDTVVILAEIVDQDPGDPLYQSGAVATYNGLLTAMAQNRINGGDKIILVDMFSALNYTDDVFDWLHPNAVGYEKMENVWLAALDDFLPTCPPVITSTAVTTATAGEAYSYDVDASGSPAPTYELTTSPSGMTINDTTGVISWTPAAGQTGDNPVAVMASSSAGTDTQSFTISVAAADVCLATPVISYWPLDTLAGGATMPDAIGDNDGACSGACPTTTSGLLGSAYVFDGSDEIDVPDDATLDWGPDDSFTIQTWVNTTQVCSGNKVFLGKFRGGTNQLGDWWLGCGDSATASNVAAFWLREGGGGSGGTNVDMRGTTSLNDGSWHHVAATYDGVNDVVRLYVDGVLEAEQAKAYNFTLGNNEALNVGHFINAFHFDGLLDEAIIHDTALSALEIEQHYLNVANGVAYCADTAVAPTFISTPITTASGGLTYSYDAQAVGLPAPTYSLPTGPSGMTINANTGALSWNVPENQAGQTVPVVIEANNGLTTQQSYNIDVTETLYMYLPLVTKSD